MKNIQAQYQDLLEGKMSKTNFMVNIRRDFPQWISSGNSFNDAVNILKSKRILNESHEGNTQWLDTFKQDIQAANLSPEKKEEAEAAMRYLGDHGLVDMYGMMQSPFAARAFMGDASEIVKRAESEMVSQMASKQSHHDPSNPGADPEVSADRFNEAVPGSTPNQTFRNPEILAKAVAKKHGKELKQKKSEGYKEFEHAALNHAFNMMIDAKMEQVVVKNLTYGLADEDWPSDYITALNQSLQGSLNEAVKKSEGKYKEVTGKAEYDVFPGADHVNYNQLMKGLQYELSKMGEITDEALVKAKQKAVKNLVKDPNAYRDLVIANVKDIEKKDKDLRMQPVKKDNMVDKANGMKVVEKDAKGNVQDNLGKKERAKSKNGEGLKHMTQTPKKSKGIAQVMEVPGKEKVLALKEHIMEDLTVENPIKKQFQTGHRVETNDGRFAGEITKFDGHTATVKLDTTGEERDFQPNFLKHSDAAPRPKLPNYQSDFIKNAPPLAQKEEMSREDKLKAIKEKLMKFVKKEVEEGAILATGQVGNTTTQSTPIYSGPTVADAIKKGKQITATTKDRLKVINTKTGEETQV